MHKIAAVLLRHMLPAGLVALCVFVLWVVGTLPVVAVFVIDDAFSLSEYAMFLAYASAVSLGISSVVLFPLALLGEALVRRTRHAIWAFPAALCLGAGMLFLASVVITQSLGGAVLGWGGLALLLAGLFGVYWAVLWAEKCVVWGARKVGQAARRLPGEA